MEIEITLHRIKVSQPIVTLFIEGPYTEPRSENEKVKDEKVKEACRVFNATMEEILGPPTEGFGKKYWWPDYFTRKYQLAWAYNVQNFTEFLKQLSAEAYAIYEETQKLEKTV